MQCEQAQTLIDDYMDGLLPSEQAAAIAHHIDDCEDCAKKVAEQQSLQKALVTMEIPSPSQGFVDRALHNAVMVNSHKQHRHGFIKGFGSALAAGLALWAVVALFPMQNAGNGPDKENVIQISLYETHDVKLAFHTDREVQGATIKIRLSDNINIAGYQGRQTLEWQTDFVKGDNVLTLPVKGLKASSGQLVAEVKHKNLTKSIVVNLNVKGKNVRQNIGLPSSVG